MKTHIPNSYFYDPDILHKEQETLFKNHWQFACFTTDLEKNNDYITLDLFNKSIVIRNCNGKLKAFLNVCSHRFSKICLKNKGNAAFQCPYHGWKYNNEGIPTGIPRKNTFDQLNQIDLKLTEFELTTIGVFCFIKLTPKSSKTLISPLHKLHDFLINVSDILNEQLDENKLYIDANWKIVLENTLEEYHVRQVHPNSLYKVGISESSFKFQTPHSSDQMTFNTKLTDFKKLNELLTDRKFIIEDYIHQLIFPTMTIASAYGATIAIQQIIPISSRKTLFISHVFSTKLANTTPEKHPVIQAFYQNAIKFNQQVFDEDKEICEAVQLGLQFSDHTSGLFSTDETRVWAFENAYMQTLKGKKYDH